MDELLTTQEVADYLKMATKTLAHWRLNKEPTGPKFIRLGSGGGPNGLIRYRKSDVDEWIKERVKQQEGEDK